METFQLIITILHTISSIFIAFYPFIIKYKKYDYLYILLFLFLNLNWNIFNNECIISYYIKKIENKNYKMGEESGKHDIDLLIKNKMILKIYHSIVGTFFVISPLYVIYRNKFSILLYIIVIYLSLSLSIIRKIKNEKLVKKNQNINIFIAIVTTIYFIYTLKIKNTKIRTKI